MPIFPKDLRGFDDWWKFFIRIFCDGSHLTVILLSPHTQMKTKTRHHSHTRGLTRAALPCIILALAGTASALTTTWTGEFNNDWGNARNWTNGVPGSDDDAVIGMGYAQSTSDRTLASLTVSGGTAALPGLTVGTLNLSAGTLSTTNTTVTGAATWTGGEIGGAISILAEVTLAIPSGTVRLGPLATLTNSGTVEMSGGQLEGYDQVVIHNHGTWNLTGHEIPFVNFYSSNTFHNYGLLRKTGTTGTIILQNGWTYHLGGETRCETGELRFAVSDHHLPAGAQLTGAGTIRMVSGTTHLEGAITETLGNLILDGATLDASSSAAVTGTLDWMSGSISGILTIPSGSRMEVHGEGFKRINTSAEIVVSGTYRWTGPAGIEGYDQCRFRIQPGGVCDLAVDGDPFNRFYDTNELINEGTLLKSAGSGGSTVCNDWTYRQRGTVQSDVSTLEFTSTLVFENTSSVTGSGNVLIRGATQLPGRVTFSAPTTWANGTWTGSAGSIRGLLLWSGGESSGTWSVDATGTLRIIEGVGTLKRVRTGSSIEVSGTIDMASGTLQGYENATIRILSGGLFSATGPAMMTRFYAGNHLEIQPGGQLVTQNGADLRVDWRLDNAGTVRTPAGQLACNYGGSSSGLFESTASGTLSFTNGTQTLTDGAEIRGPGEVNLSGGVLEADAPVEAFVHVAGGYVRGAGENGELRFKDGSQWTSGYLEGRARVLGGATLAVSGPPETTRQMNTQATLAIDGRLLWQGAGPILGYESSVIEVAPSGMLEITGDGEVFSQFYGGNQLVNHGLIRRSSSGGDVSIRHFACRNDGTIETGSGRLLFHTSLNLADGGVITGVGRTVCASGVTTLVGSTQVSSSPLELAGATLSSDPSDNGTLTGGTIDWSSGYISGTVTLNGLATTTGSGFRRLNSKAELRNAGMFTLAGGGEIQGYELSTLRNLPGATLHATGQVRLTKFYSSNSVINEGTMTIGSSPGRMIIDSPFVQTASGRLEIGVAGAGTDNPDFDILQINASATIAGTLVANLESGYNPAEGTAFEVLKSSHRSGVFDQLIAPRFHLTYPTTGNPPVSLNNVVLVATAGTALDLATWAASHNLTGDDALPGADLDRDGSPNLVEYALNMDPEAPDVPPLTSGVESISGGDWLVIHYRRWQDRMNAGLMYQAETSIDLSGWTPSGIIDEPDPGALSIPDSEARRCRIPKDGGRNFLRLTFGLAD